MIERILWLLLGLLVIAAIGVHYGPFGTIAFFGGLWVVLTLLLAAVCLIGAVLVVVAIATER